MAAKIGAMQDKLEEVLDKLDPSDVERLIVSLAKKYGVELPGGGGGMQGLGRDDFGEVIGERDEVLDSSSIFGTRVRVNVDAAHRRGLRRGGGGVFDDG